MSTQELISRISPDTVWWAIQNYWTIPAGMLALFFYGRFHFNTPEYPLDVAIDTGTTMTDAHLITPAPPMFTTRRHRYNHYANWYVLILEAAFIGIIVCYTLFADIGRVLKQDWPDLSGQTLQYRAVVALFILTGLLSSFPMFKEIDIWLLGKLHRAAYIPDDVQYLAEQLYRSVFKPAPESITTVRANLAMRDTARVADGNATGSLERRIVDLLCLRTQIQTNMASQKLKEFRITMERDFRSIGYQAQGLQAELKAYFKDQQRLVPSDTRDIDAYIEANADNSANPNSEDIADLARHRQELQAKCDRLYEVICLVIALSLFATEFTQEDIDLTIVQMGFKTKINLIPVANWDAVGLVTISTFVLMLAFTGIFVIFAYVFKLSDLPGFLPSRGTVVGFALIYTTVYAIVMSMAIRLKQHWRRIGQAQGARPENLLIAIYVYAVTVSFNVVIHGMIHDWELTYVPLLFALNQAVLGYFVGLYIDRSLKTDRISLELAFLQGISQAIAAEIATTIMNGGDLGLGSSILIGIFTLSQAALSGFIVGVLFQHFYKQTSPPREVIDSPSPELATAI